MNTVSLLCEKNQAVVGIKSRVGHRNDREFGLNCASIPGIEILEHGLLPSGLEMTDNVHELEWANEYKQESFKFECPMNHVVTGVYSEIDRQQGDRYGSVRPVCFHAENER